MTPIDKVRLSVDAVLVGGTATAGYYAITSTSKVEEQKQEIIGLKQNVMDAAVEVNKLEEKVKGLVEETQECENINAQLKNEVAQAKIVGADFEVIQIASPES